MWRRAASLCLFLALGACKPEASDELILLVRYDSSLELDSVVVWGVREDGSEGLARQTLEVPLSLDPPGQRTARYALTAPSAGRLELSVDGLDAQGAIIGTGRAALEYPTSREVAVELFAPVGPPPVPTCGNGALDPGEACDDGNTAPGDGCDSLCALEGQQTPRFYRAELSETFTSSAAGFVPAALSVTPRYPGEAWLLLVSGLLSSSDPAELSVQLRVLVDDREVDLVGHQTMAGSSAGFLTFELLELEQPASVRIQLEALAGEASVSSLRLVAAALPPGAEAVQSRAELVERAGLQLELSELNLSVERAGRYVVLAKGSVSELPGDETAQLWLVDEQGQAHPEDEQGVRFSNGRGAASPMFTAHLTDLEPGDHRFSLRGSSSGLGDITGWWDERYGYRLPVSITADQVDVDAGYTVSVTLDHAAWVQAGRARADGADVRVVYQGGDEPVELVRVLDDDSGWEKSDTQLWFRTAAPIPARAEELGYFIYFGQAEASAPPADPRAVFFFHDDFETALDQRWDVQSPALALVNQGRLAVLPQGRVASVPTFGLSTQWEARLRLTVPMAEFMLYWVANVVQPLSEITGMGFYMDANGHGAGNIVEQQTFALDSPTDFHRFAFWRHPEGNVVYEIDGQFLANLATSNPLVNTQVLLQNQASADLADPPLMIYEWVRVRPRLENPPRVQTGELEGLSGLDLSRWSHLKILAFRADAFASLQADLQPSAAIVQSDQTQVHGALTTEAPSAAVDYLMIQSARISGLSSETGRKSGVISSGEARLETAHVINRDGSAFRGYHHIAGMADVVTTAGSRTLENGARSPDGIEVQIADSVIICLEYPAER